MDNTPSSAASPTSIRRRAASSARSPLRALLRTIVSAAGSVWVGESDSGQVVRINPRTATFVGRSITTDGALLQLATAKGAIWVADAYHSRLLAIDPADDRITRRRSLPGILTISAAGAKLWALFDRQREIVSLKPCSSS
jgi:streptogramin lyase